MITVYENPWFAVIREGGFHFVREAKAVNGAAVLIVAGTDFILVEVERPALGCTLLEVPRGYGNEGETSSDCALREGFEETGFRLGVPVFLGKVSPNSGILRSQVDLFICEAIEPHPVKDPDGEVVGVVRVSISESGKFVADGRINDGFTLACLAHFWSRNAGRAL